MTCKCGFHLNPPNNPCKCDGKRPASDHCEIGCKYPWCKDGGMCKIDFEELLKAQKLRGDLITTVE